MAKHLTSFHSMMTVELNSMEANDITDPIDIQRCRLINAHHPTLQNDQCCKDDQNNFTVMPILNWSHLCTENDKKWSIPVVWLLHNCQTIGEGVMFNPSQFNTVIHLSVYSMIPLKGNVNMWSHWTLPLMLQSIPPLNTHALSPN